MSRPVFEKYEIKNTDSEAHCIDVILEALKRHTPIEVGTGKDRNIHRLRIIKYVQERVGQGGLL